MVFEEPPGVRRSSSTWLRLSVYRQGFLFETDFLPLVAALRRPFVGAGHGHGLLEIIFPFLLKSLLMCFEVGDLPQDRCTFQVRRISQSRV
jgi:hypothetical protein